MRRWSSVCLSALLVLVPGVARPCGFDPCYRTGYDDGPPLDSRIVRPRDWRYQRLPSLLRAYFGEAALPAEGAGSSARARLSRTDYEAAVARLFAGIGRPAPALPDVAREQPAWDGVCAGNDYRSAATYIEAIAADAALAAHAERLVAWRTRLVGMCPSQREDVETLVTELEAASAADPSLGDGAGYIVAAALFYGGRSADAAAAFDVLAASPRPWIREAAAYTRGRALLVAAQAGWDGYSDVGRIDAGLLTRAGEAFASYARAYPRGRYVASATNMARRVAFLAGDGDTLNRLTVEHFARLLDARDFDAIGDHAASEITNYLDVSAFTVDTFPFDQPLLAATLGPHVGILIDDAEAALARLARAKGHYAPYPGVYELVAVPLLAAAGRTDATTLSAPANAPEAIRLAVLYERAAALERARRYPEARRVLHEVAVALPELVQDDGFVADIFRLHLADGEYGDAYAPGSPFTQAAIAADLFERIASEDTLRQLATGDGAVIAHRELLFRMLRQRRWADFLALYEHSGRPEPFTEAETAVRALARAPDDAKGLFNVGYFLYQRNGVGGDCCACERLEAPPRAVTGEGIAPIGLYEEAIARLAAAPDASLEPKVLHYAIMCFKESSDAAACQRGFGGAQVAPEIRAAWFRRLKTAYPRSSWAAKTRYYY